MSQIHPQTRAVVSLVSSAHHAHAATGAALYGTNLMAWPAKAFDVASIVASAEREVEAAYQELAQRDRRGT